MSPQVSAKSVETKSSVRPISQISLTIFPKNSTKEAFEGVVSDVLHWIRDRAGVNLPREAWKLESFELTAIGSQRCSAISMRTPQYWTARFDDADKNVPMRTWTTEVGVGIDSESGNILLGTRLLCVTRGPDALFVRSVPSFIRKITKSQHAELDGFKVPRKIQVLEDTQEVDHLISLLENPTRRSDVIVFSLPESFNGKFNSIKIAEKVYSATKGGVHVFAISAAGSELLSRVIGEELSVYGQRVRTYRPGFKSWDQGSSHPFALPEKIQNWNGGSANDFADWLINQSLGNSAHAPDSENFLPYFNTVRRIHSEELRLNLRKSGGSDQELLSLYEDDNTQLRQEIQDQKTLYDGLLASADTESKKTVLEANSYKATALSRLHRIRQLEAELEALSNKHAAAIPDSLDGFEQWCGDNLAGSVELVNKAYQGIKKSGLADVKLIYKSLLLLRDYYVPMRRIGGIENKERYEEGLRVLQLEESGTGEGIKYAPDTYSVEYNGKRRSLDKHLKGSNSRDRRFGFRLYFFWDDESEVVVVGWLPSHLDNRLS